MQQRRRSAKSTGTLCCHTANTRRPPSVVIATCKANRDWHEGTSAPPRISANSQGTSLNALGKARRNMGAQRRRRPCPAEAAHQMLQLERSLTLSVLHTVQRRSRQAGCEGRWHCLCRQRSWWDTHASRRRRLNVRPQARNHVLHCLLMFRTDCCQSQLANPHVCMH